MAIAKVKPIMPDVRAAKPSIPSVIFAPLEIAVTIKTTKKMYIIEFSPSIFKMFRCL